jgi:hypothetical protein
MPAAEAYYLHSVIPSSRGCGASMSVWSAQTISSKQLGDRGPGRYAAAVTDDRRTTAVQMLALLALPLLNQRQRERQPRLQTSAMPWPCCCCCCVSLSTSSAQSTPVTNAPMPRQIPYPALPSLPSSLLLSSCSVLCLQPIRPPLPFSAVLLLGPSAPRVPSHLLLCSPTASLCPPSQRHLPALPVSSEMPVCWPSRGGVAEIALKSPCLPSAPTCGSISATWEGGIKSYCIVRAYSRTPGTYLGLPSELFASGTFKSAGFGPSIKQQQAPSSQLRSVDT